ncbi:MAG: DNA-protecting protein DprA [Bacteroidetes bacterium]|nr:DNA-protecting protein DprA [Bacteroidota bacterium]
MSLHHQLALTFLRNIGPVAAKGLLEHFGDASQVFKVSRSKWLKVPGIGEWTLEGADIESALLRAEQEMRFIEDHGIRVLFYTDLDYPKRLKNCIDSPVLLYSRGNMDLNAKHVVSVVGTRLATEYGKELCRQLVEELQQYNVLIVSGLAAGIDTAAHRESVKRGLSTVGVLGHGLERMYPAGNRSLAEKMMENGGLLTEYPSGTTTVPENFPQRNRIVAGMADATVVIEAGIKGGALITAEIANSYNRDVFAFPGRINDTYSEGCNFLVRNNKAALLTCAADLAYSLGWEEGDVIKPKKEQLVLPMDLSDDERLIINIIHQHKAPLAIDDLTIKANMPMSKLAINLLNMEMQGYIRSLPGKTYCIN